jgi:hypothetical protein
MKPKVSVLFLVAFSLIASSFAFAGSFGFARPELPADTLAEVTVSGGFMAPGVVNTTIYEVDMNGVVTRISFHRGDFGPSRSSSQVIAKLNNVQLRQLEGAISQIRPGQLVDASPNGPQGADFPTVSYLVQNGAGTFSIADRIGNGHTLILQEKPAYVVKAILDRVISG